MVENNARGDTSNWGDNPDLGLIENDKVGQENVTVGGYVTSDMPSGFGIDALLALHPEERRNVMAAIANSLEIEGPRRDPQPSLQPLTTSQALHTQYTNRTTMGIQTVIPIMYPNPTFEIISQ